MSNTCPRAVAAFQEKWSKQAAIIDPSLEPLRQFAAALAASPYVRNQIAKRNYVAINTAPVSGLTAAINEPDMTGHISESLHKFLRQHDSDITPLRKAAAVGSSAAVAPPASKVSAKRICARTKAIQLTQ
jgi:hypothetical protein